MKKKKKQKRKKQKEWYFTLHHTHFGGPLHYISNKAGKVNKIHYNNTFSFLRIIIIYINSNIAALVQYYSSKGKLNANNFFFGNLVLFCIYLLLFDYVATIFFSLSFLATCHNSFFSPPHFRQLGCHNPFFSLLTPLKFQQLGCHNWFFPFEYFYFGHLINLGSQIRAK